MRFRVPALLFTLVVGCSYDAEKETLTPTRSEAAVVPAADSPEQSSAPEQSAAAAGTSTIDTPSDSPRTTEPMQPDRDAFDRLRLDPEGTCPFPASACPESCVSVTGARRDEAKQCVSSVVVGCLPRNGQVNSDLRCYRSNDGIVVEGSGSLRPLLGPDWSGCPLGGASALAASAPACP